MAEKEFYPSKALAMVFLIAILIGTLLLMLPASTKHRSISSIDALFTATSAVCVTGLTVKDTPVHFSPTGQAIILALIQIGGLGIMTFSTLIILSTGRKISIKDRLLIQTSYYQGSPRDVKSLLRHIIGLTFFIEAGGAVILFPFFNQKMSAQEAAWSAIFHSVSAFCNAGFSVFSDSLNSYRGHVGVNLTIIMLIIIGGIGFPVLYETRNLILMRPAGKKFNFSLHTKIVILTTSILIIFSSLFIYLYESSRSFKAFPQKEKILASLFLAITPRTAGFVTVEPVILTSSTIMLILILMFIGASPGSTGGGVKTTTLAVLFFYLKAKIKARQSTEVFRRSLPQPVLINALTLFFLGFGAIFLAAAGLLLSQPLLNLKEALFESFSAFGTVGLSLGITQGLTFAGKLIIIFTMYLGRVGPLNILYSISRESGPCRYQYAEENVLIG